MFRQLKDLFSAAKKPAKQHPKTLQYEELEQRVLFSADFVPGLDNIAVDEQVLVQDVTNEFPVEREAAPETVEQTAAETRRELAIVNEDVADYEQLIAGLQGSNDNRIIEEVVLDADRDGIEQVSDILAERSDVAAVHFITHGSEGQINLGNSRLTSTTLAVNSDAVAGWGKALTETGDILFYGCNIAADSDGQTLLDDIAKLTGAEVAASDDLTGSGALGGDWELEYNAGKVETSVAISQATQQTWSGVLSTFTVSSTADSGAGSLREAIIDANASANSGGPDVITFNIGADGSQQTINLLSALDPISEAVIIDGFAQYGAMTPTVPIIEINGAGTSGADGLTLAAGSDGSTIRGLAIYGFDVDGIKIASDGNTIEGNHIGTDAAGTGIVGNADEGIEITGHNNTIGGTTTAQRNIIINNADDGMLISGANGNIVLGNYIGVDINGVARGNGANGIAVKNGASDNVIGGTADGAGNVISGNTSNGIAIRNSGTTGNRVEGNYIGTDPTGTAARSNVDGIQITDGASNNTIGGATTDHRNIISGNSVDGIEINGANSNTITGNYIGTDSSGTLDQGNGVSGILITNGASSNTIGGLTAAEGNIISGNDDDGLKIEATASSGNTVIGNYIGLDASGTSTLGNSGSGVDGQADGTIIGGTASGSRNVISGNTYNGIAVSGDNTTIQGNYIGTDATGAADLGNARRGIWINGASSNVIGGTDPNAGNVISGNDYSGVRIEGAAATLNTLQGNIIGLNAAGTTAIGNSQEGVEINSGSNNTIGGSDTAARNVISGNGSKGVDITVATATGNIVRGNYIGTNAAGDSIIANNGEGIKIWQNASDNTVGGVAAGEGNLIAGSSIGVLISDAGTTGNAILGNAIYSSTGLGIDLTASGNNDQSYAVLASAGTNGADSVTISGSLSSAAGTTYRIEFFASTTADGSGYGEAERYLGATSVTTDGSGDATINANLSALVASGEFVTATATVDLGSGDYGDTSEFALNVAAAAINDAPVITSNGGGTNAGINVVENTTIVTTVTATDADLDTLTYSISGGADAALFSIDSNTGVLTFKTAPDFEVPTDTGGNNFYDVTVKVEDGNGGTDSQDIIVTVTNSVELFIVTNTADSGVDSLRQAILDANANTNSGGPDVITFNIAADGSQQTINLLSALDPISEAVIIDGFSQYGALTPTVPIIEINGAGAINDGLSFASTSDGSVVQGLMITGFSRFGIQVDSGADGITILGNWIGTTGTGYIGVGNLTGINIQGANTIIGGTGTNDGNVITNNGNEGINVTGSGATGTIIQGNIIGLDPDGSTGSGNADVGIALLPGTHNTTIGGTTVAARNIISNNYEGIEINSNNNIVQGNYIGTDITGTLDRGNRLDDGVEIQNGATGNLIGGTAAGAGNLIAFNARDGVYVRSGTGNVVLGNQIHSNSGLGIDLGTNGVTANDISGTPPVPLHDSDSGPNNLQNCPVLTAADIDSASQLTIDGTLKTNGLNQDYRIEFFRNTIATGQDPSSYGEGEDYLDFITVTTDGSGNATFSTTLTAAVADGEFITATATVDLGGGNYGDTSEFSLNVTAAAVNDAPSVSTTGTFLAYTEGAVATPIDPGLTLSDVDSTNLVNASVSIVSGFSTGEDVLAFTNQLGITGSYNATTGILSLSGTTTVANYQSALRSVTYENTSEMPSTTNRIIMFQVNDGAANSNSNRTVSVASINDDPTNNGTLPTDVTVIEGVSSGVNLSAIDFGDLDHNNQLLTVTLTTSTGGRLYAWTDMDVIVSGSGGPVITLQGGLANLNAFFNSPTHIQYLHSNTNLAGDNADTIQVQIRDNGNTGSGGGSNINLGTVNVDITNVNDTPVANDNAYAIEEDDTLTANWWNITWTCRQELTFDNTAQAETLTDFPVLVILNSSNIDYTQTKDDGTDLRFFAADGTPLAYEIEQWNEGGDSSVWVRVPQITGSSNSDSIWMYYGNDAAKSGEAAGGVWDSNFVGVWHLNEEQIGTGTSGVYKDSTSIGNNGIDRVAATGQEGQVTDGQKFGANDWIEIDHDPSLNLKDSMTISFWIKPTSDSGTFNRVVEKGLWGYQDSYYFGGGNGTNDLTFYLNDQEVFDTSDNVLTVGEWQHCTVSYTSNGDGTGSARLYINGVEVDINGDPAGVAAPPIGTYNSGIVTGNTGRLAIGHSDPLYDFDGFIDEVQISDTDRSADWIAAQYLATKNQFGGEFVQFGGEESAPAVGGVLSNDTDVDGDPFTVTLIDGPDNAQSFTLNKDGTFTYTPTANYHGSDSFTYEVSDGNGGTAQATATITVNPINDAPAGANNTVSTAEDTDYVFAAANFGFTDPNDSPADNFANVIITTTVANGTLYVDANGNGLVDGGEALSDLDTVSVADITAGRLKFKPAANENGTGYDSFTFQVVDDGAGADTDLTANTMTVDVNAVNDAPIARPDGVHLSFDGDDFIQVADAPSLQMTSNVTIEAWINHDGTDTGSKIIVNKEGEYEVGITAETGEIKFAFANQGTPDNWAWHNTGYFVTAGEWTHVAVTYDGVAGEAKTYINGELVDTFAQSGNLGDVYPTFNELWIGGRQNDPADRFKGQIDEVRVWSSTRTQGEIQASMGGQLTGGESGLAGNWRLDEAFGSVAIDQSASGNDGVLGGSEGAAATPTYQGYSISEDSLLTVPAGTGLLANDFDADGDILTVTNVDTTGMLGNLVVNAADGSFTYDPRGVLDSLGAGERLRETFTYTANDGSVDSSPVTVTIMVVGVNDAPVNAVPGAQSVTEDTALAIGGISVSDVDGNLASTQISVTNGTLNVTLSGTTISAGANGSNTLTISGSQADINATLASLTYQGNANFNGSDTLTVISTDSAGTPLSDTDTVDITVDPVADLSAQDDAFNTDEDTLLNGNVATNDTTTSGGTLTYAVDTDVTSGSLSFNNDGTFSYTPDTNFVGNDSFTYIVTDADSGESSTQTATITVNTINNPPVNTVPGAQSVTEDTALAIGGISVSDVDGNLASTQISVTNGTLNVTLSGTTISAGANGSNTLTISGSQADINATLASLTYQGNANFNGSDTLTVISTDSAGTPLSDTDTVDITVDPVADLSAQDDAFNTDEDTLLNGNVATNDTTTSGGTLTYAVDTDVTSGSLSFNNDGTFSYTPDTNFVGNDSFTYIVTDADSGESSTQTATITVNTINDPPVNTVPGAQSVTEDTALAIGGISVSDVDGNLASTQISVTNGTLNVTLSGTTISAGANGSNTLTISGSQADINATLASLTYQGNANFNGSDTLTVISTDSAGTPLSDTDTVDITVDPVADLSAQDDAFNTDEDTLLNGNVATNDTTTSGGTLTYAVDTDVTSGSLSFNNDGTFSYTPDTNFVGNDSFTYIVTDADSGESSTQTATITVNTINNPPVNTVPGVQSVNEDTALAIGGISVSDVDGNLASTQISVTNGTLNVTLSGTTISAGANGSNTLTISGSQADINATLASLTYQGNANFNGSDTLTVISTDSAGTPLSDTDTVTVNVTAVNDTPTTTGIADVTVDEDAADSVVDLFAAFADVEDLDAALTYSVVGNTNPGLFTATTIDGVAGSLTLNYAADQNGAANITVRATDSGGQFVETTFTVTVNPVNDAPVIGGTMTGTVVEDGTLNANGTLTISDVDISDNPISFPDEAIILGDNGYGDFVLTGGTWTYTLNNSHAAVQALDVGESLTDTHIFTASDGSTQLVTMTINGAEDASVLGGVTAGAVTEDGALTASDEITITDVDTADNPVNWVDEAATAGDNGYGTFQLTGGTWTYTLNNTHAAVQALDVGESLTDTYTFTATDGSTQLVTMIINGAENAPIAVDDAVSGDEDTVITGNVLTNDTDTEADPLTANLVSGPAHGSLTLSADGSFSYTPDADWNGTDSFTYTANDGALDSNVATMTITVNPVNDAPSVSSSAVTTATENAAYSYTITANDIDGDDLTITASTLPAWLTLVDNGDGTATLSGTPTNADVGEHSVELDISDGELIYLQDFTLTVSGETIDPPADDTDPDLRGSTTPDPELFENPETDDEQDPDTEAPTQEDPAQDPVIEAEQAAPVVEDLTTQDSAHADDQLVHMQDPQINEEILYLTDDDDMDSQSEERDDDPSIVYYDNDLYKDLSLSKYVNINYTAADGSNLKSEDDLDILYLDSDDQIPVDVNGDYDLHRQQIDESFDIELKSQETKAKIVSVTAASFAAGFVSYLLRAGSLVANLMSTLPLWRGFDPIVIFSGNKKKKKKDRNEIPDTNEAKSETLFDDEVE